MNSYFMCLHRERIGMKRSPGSAGLNAILHQREVCAFTVNPLLLSLMPSASNCHD